MPEKDDPGTKLEEKRQFINEKIIKQPMTRRQVFSRLLAFFFVAVIFGIVAAVSFAVSRPIAVRYLGGETTIPESSISIPKDEPSENVLAFTDAVTEEETEPIEKVVQSAVEKYRYSIDDVESLYTALRYLAQDVDKGIVLVHSVQQEVDWFDNPVETTGQYAGAVIASTRRELLILTPAAVAENADAIKVMFSDGTEVDGRIKQKDQMYGMAVVSVDIDSVEEDTWKTVTTLPLGNSYTVKQGDFVLAIGGPAGVVHSVDYGFVSYIKKNVQIIDGVGRALYVNTNADTATGTFLVNTSGELIGWVTDQLQTDDNNSSMPKVFGISDYKAALERMTNGLGIPYFGIRGQEVDQVPASSVLPQGVYVQNVVIDGPAYNGGIQNGDIITGMNDETIVTMKDFLGVMEDQEYGQIMNVIVQRYGRDQYTQLEFQVTLGTR